MDETKGRQWRIELCERPVRKAQRVDMLLFGRALCHPFLALIDEHDKVLGEIHLVPFDRSTTTRTRTRLNRLFELATAATVPMHVDKAVRGVVGATPLGRYYPTLHSLFYDHAAQYAKALVRQELVTDSPSRTRTTWNLLRMAATRLDARNLPYDRFGSGRGRNNCQSGLATILAEAGLPVIPLSGQFAAPGWNPRLSA